MPHRTFPLPKGRQLAQLLCRHDPQLLVQSVSLLKILFLPLAAEGKEVSVRRSVPGPVFNMPLDTLCEFLIIHEITSNGPGQPESLKHFRGLNGKPVHHFLIFGPSLFRGKAVPL